MPVNGGPRVQGAIGLQHKCSIEHHHHVHGAITVDAKVSTEPLRGMTALYAIDQLKGETKRGHGGLRLSEASNARIDTDVADRLQKFLLTSIPTASWNTFRDFELQKGTDVREFH